MSVKRPRNTAPLTQFNSDKQINVFFTVILSLYLYIYAVEEGDFSNFVVFFGDPMVMESLKYQGNLKLALLGDRKLLIN